MELFAILLLNLLLQPGCARDLKGFIKGELDEILKIRLRRNLYPFCFRLILVFAFSFSGVFPVAVKAQSNPSKMRIPFELTQSRIYVEAFVNEQGPFRFMVDTGADGIGRADVRLVKDLGLTSTGTTTNSDGVNTSNVETIAIRSLRIGQLTRHNVQVPSRDYNSRPAPDSRILMGIIGNQFFSGYLLKIDYQKSEMALSKGSLKSSEANVLHYDTNNLFVVPLRIGQYDTVGLIDTGSVLEMHLPLAWAEKLKIQTLKDAGEGRRANTVFKLFSAQLPVAVNIGGNTITGTDARFSELANRVNIGGAFLVKNRCVVTSDQKNNLVKMRCSRK